MTSTLERQAIHTTHSIGLRTDIDDGDVHGADFDGYYTIKLAPETCGCGHVMEFSECDSAHLIVVWEERDDKNLLHAAAGHRDQGYDPKVVEYQASFGKCIDFYVAREQNLIGG